MCLKIQYPVITQLQREHEKWYNGKWLIKSHQQFALDENGINVNFESIVFVLDNPNVQ